MTIGVLFTGGTIGSTHSAAGIAPSGAATRRLLADYQKKTGDGATFPTVEPYTILSENLTFSHVTKLADCIKQQLAKWDAVIVTHGTDTLQYTSAALSYLLGADTPPIVLVSANHPLEDARGNGLDNFCGAVDFLRQHTDAKGVFVSYKNTSDTLQIHRGARLLPHAPFSDDVHSLGGAIFEQKNGIFTPVDGFFEQKDAQPPFVGANFSAAEGKVLRLQAHPGMVYPALDGIAAVLIECYHSGTLPTDTDALRRFAKAAKEQGVPVFLSGVPSGGTAYESGAAFSEMGLIAAPPISPIAAFIKLSLAASDGRDLQSALSLPLGGDL